MSELHPDSTQPWQSRIVRHADVPPGELTPSVDNARRHSKRQQKAMLGMLQEVGWVQSVIVSQRSGKILDGHLRHDLAVRQAEPTVPVVFVDVTEAQEKIILAAYDAMGDLADLDPSQLNLLLEGIQLDEGQNLSFLDFLDGQAIESSPVPTVGASSPEEEMVRFAGSGVKQLVFYVNHASYGVIVDKLEWVRTQRRLRDHSAVLLQLLEEAYDAAAHD